MSERSERISRLDAAESRDAGERSGSEPIARRAARVLLVDGAARVLLLRGFDPANPVDRYWFTVGGGLDPGETPAQGAARELFEETGLRAMPADFGEPVWHDVTEFPFDGRRYRQEQDYFLLRVDRWVVDHANFDEIERRSVDSHRWWSVDELVSTSQRFYPAQLPDLVTRLLAGGAQPGPGPASARAAAPVQAAAQASAQVPARAQASAGVGGGAGSEQPARPTREARC